MLDHTVAVIGSSIESALQETIRLGPDDKPRWEPKYTLRQLLDPLFRLPLSDEQTAPDLDRLKGIGGFVVD